MEILIIGAWSAVVWAVAWATCSNLNRRRQHLYSKRLREWERQRQLQQAAWTHNVERLRR